MRAIWKRELRGYFYTPVGYVFLCVFLSAASVIFYLSLLSRSSADMPSFISFLSLLWMLLSPILTMRLLAEERRSKTDQLLLTSPVPLPAVVLGKYLAAVTVLVFAAVLTLVYAGVISLYGTVYPGELAVNLLGFLLLGCAFAAMDLFISSCMSNPVTAAVTAFGANFFLWILDLAEQSVSVVWISDALRFISLYRRSEPLIAGQLSFASVFFDLAFIAAFLALTVFRLDARRIRRLRFRAVSAALLALVIASLTILSVGAQSLEKRNGWTVDASFNGITTHTDETKRLLDSLDKNVHIQALFARGDEDTELMALLDRYAANEHITWEQVDPRLNPGLIRQYTTAAAAPEEYDLIITCAETGHWKLVKSDDYIGARIDYEAGVQVYDQLAYERVISRAIDYVSRDRVPQVVILYGFREEVERNAALFFESFLEANRYEVTFRQLSDFTPDPRDLLVFLCPQRDLTADERRTLEDFADAGGNFLFVRDPGDPLPGDNYKALLNRYGFECLPGIVVADDAYYDNIPTYLLPDMESSVVTLPLLARGADHIRLPGAAAFRMPERAIPLEEEPPATDYHLTTTCILFVDGYMKQLTADTVEWESGDEAGTFAVALSAELVDSNVSRAFILGNSAALMSEEYYSVTDMPLFTIGVLEWLMDLEYSSLDIVSRDAARPLLRAGDRRTGALVIVALPAAVLLAALLVLKRRRG